MRFVLGILFIGLLGVLIYATAWFMQYGCMLIGLITLIISGIALLHYKDELESVAPFKGNYFYKRERIHNNYLDEIQKLRDWYNHSRKVFGYADKSILEDRHTDIEALRDATEYMKHLSGSPELHQALLKIMKNKNCSRILLRDFADEIKDFERYANKMKYINYAHNFMKDFWTDNKIDLEAEIEEYNKENNTNISIPENWNNESTEFFSMRKKELKKYDSEYWSADRKYQNSCEFCFLGAVLSFLGILLMIMYNIDPWIG